MATEQLLVRLRMDSTQYKREAREAAAATGQVSNHAKTAATRVTGLGTAAEATRSQFKAFKGAAVIGGITAVVSGLSAAVTAAEEAASAVANTEQILRTTGGVANVTAEDIDELTNRLAALTGIEDEVVREGANMLLTFRNVRNEVGDGNDVFDRATGLMLDISRVMGTDTASAAKQLGKALNDPVAQMGALSRAGLTFNDQQKDQIRTLVANNDLLGAQTLILDELETQLGGTAEASAKATDKIGVAFGELLEAGGEFLLPLLEDIATELQTIAGLGDELDRVAAHAGGTAESAEALLTAIVGFRREVPASADAMNGLTNRTDDYRESIVELAKRLPKEELRRAIDGLSLLTDQFGFTSEEAQALRDILVQELASGLTESETAARNASKEIQDMLGDKATDPLARYGRKVRESGGDIDDLAVDADEAASAFGNQERAIDRTVRLLGSYEDGIRRITDPVFAALDDVQNLTEAQDAYNEAVKEFGDDSPEATQAAFDLARAQQDVNTSLQGLPEGLQGAADTIGILGRQAGLSEDQIRRLQQAVNDLDGTEANVRVFVNVVGGSQISGLNPNRDIVLRQHGGPLGRGQTALVGERGPELFVPQTPGLVISNADIKALIAGMKGSTHNYNIPISSSGNVQSDAQLVGAVAAVLRRMESL